MEAKLLSTINHAIKNNSLVVLWVGHDDSLVKVHGKIKTIKERSRAVRIDINQSELSICKKEFNNCKIINLSLVDEALSFATELIFLGEDGKCLFKFPDKFQFTDRRQSNRFVFNLPVEILLNNKKPIIKQCYDISATGISILLGRNEKFSFLEGEFITGAIIKINDINIKSDLIVQRIDKIKIFEIENNPYAGAKVSLQFHKSGDIVRKRLEKEIQKINFEMIKKI